jgi:hypothetical protein
MPEETPQLVTANPTWEYPIKSFFNLIDVNHMLKITGGNLNLSKYEDVKANGDGIYDRVTRTGPGRMPEPPSEPWTQEMQDTFKKWQDDGYPES